jgi:hypothetical protein
LVGGLALDVLALVVGLPGRLVRRVAGRHDPARPGAELVAAADLYPGGVDEVAPPLLVRGITDDHDELLAMSGVSPCLA